MFSFSGFFTKLHGKKESVILLRAMSSYFLATFCVILLHPILNCNAQGNVKNVSASSATAVIDDEWWRSSPRICKKSCIVQV